MSFCHLSIFWGVYHFFRGASRSLLNDAAVLPREEFPGRGCVPVPAALGSGRTVNLRPRVRPRAQGIKSFTKRLLLAEPPSARYKVVYKAADIDVG
jgi:hypothetical protein